MKSKFGSLKRLTVKRLAKKLSRIKENTNESLSGIRGGLNGTKGHEDNIINILF